MADIMQVLGEADFTKLVEQEIPSGNKAATAGIKNFGNVAKAVANIRAMAEGNIEAKEGFINSGNPRLNKVPIKAADRDVSDKVNDLLWNVSNEGVGKVGWEKS
jgi:hypothetical protein